MPILAAHSLGIRVGMDRQYLGMSFGARRIGMNVWLPERAAEPLVGFDIHGLVAEEQDLVFRQGLMQLVDLPIGQWSRERYPLNIRTNTWRDRGDVDGVIGHG